MTNGITIISIVRSALLASLLVFALFATIAPAPVVISKLNPSGLVWEQTRRQPDDVIFAKQQAFDRVNLGVDNALVVASRPPWSEQINIFKFRRPPVAANIFPNEWASSLLWGGVAIALSAFLLWSVGLNLPEPHVALSTRH